MNEVEAGAQQIGRERKNGIERVSNKENELGGDGSDEQNGRGSDE